MATLVLGAAILRLLPHPPNVTPVAAMALFGGAHFDRTSRAFAVPLAAMFISDALLQWLFGWGFHGQMVVVYLCFVATVGIGLLLRRRVSVLSVAAAAFSSSTLFFVTTNLAVWAAGSLYPHSAAGLLSCYVAALPFYGLTLAGDLFYTAVLFGTFALAERRFPLLALPRPA